MPSLIESIRQRAQKQTEFGYGIMTADRYVKNMQDVVGLDLCYQMASTRQMSFADALQKASKTLVYSNQDMLVLEKGTPSQARLDGIEVPKNTLMLFKHVLTSPRKDRDGDVLRTEGALVDPKMLLLWQHVHTLPIGKMLAVVEHNSKRLTLLSCIVDINELSHDAAVMVDNDMARFSHGFRALEFSELKETEGEVTSPGGFDIKKFEIMEESVVSVPSNADAEVQEVMLSLVEGGKLTSPMMKEYGKTLRQQQPLMVVSGITFDKGVDDETSRTEKRIDFSTPKETHANSSQDNGTEKDGSSLPQVKIVDRCNMKRFDVELEHLEASKLEYEWASRWLDCQIKEMQVVSTFVPNFRKGSFLTGLKHEEAKWELRDTRKLTRDGREEPPSYEVVQLNSRISDTFLTSGIKFYQTDQKQKICVKFSEEYRGVVVTTYVKLGNDVGGESIDNAWKFAFEHNFLKGESFSLAGDFIPKATTEWDEVFLEPQNKQALQRTIRLLNDQQTNMPNRGVIVMGPPGCLHADTLIYDPINRTTKTVKDRFQKGDDFHVFAKTPSGDVTIAKAEAPWKYDPADMVRIKFESGREFCVTKGHRFLSSIDQDSYVTASQIIDRVHAGHVVALPSISLACNSQLEYDKSPQSSNLESCLSDRRLNAQRSKKTAASYLERCLLDCHQYGELPHEEEYDEKLSAPSRGDALPRTHALLHRDDQDISRKCTSPTLFGPLANLDCLNHSAAPLGDELGFDFDAGTFEYSDDLHSKQQPFGQQTSLTDTVVCNNRFLIDPTIESLVNPCSDMGPPDTVLDKVVEIEDIGKHSYYDFHVPNYENYWAGGCFHHNTGKTLSGRVVLNEAKATFIWVAAKDFWKMGAIDGLCSAFELAKELSPAVIFMEDVDNWMSSYAVDVIKTEMDGIGRTKGVVTILTTNYPERFPDALIDRPGRFHDVLLFDLPSEKVRREMLTKWTEGAISDLTVESLVKSTDGFSGAHLYELVYFAKTLQTEDVNLSMDNALVKAVEKIHSQRELIDQSQLAGSNFRNNKDCSTKVKEYMRSLPALHLKSLLAKSATEKAGRVLSASNLKMLQDCYDDLAACVDTDKNMARGTQAICERCMGRLEKVIGAASMDSDSDDKPKKDVTVKEAMALFLAESTESDRLKMLAVLQTMESIKASDERVKQYKSFMGL